MRRRAHRGRPPMPEWVLDAQTELGHELAMDWCEAHGYSRLEFLIANRKRRREQLEDAS